MDMDMDVVWKPRNSSVEDKRNTQISWEICCLTRSVTFVKADYRIEWKLCKKLLFI